MKRNKKLIYRLVKTQQKPLFAFLLLANEKKKALMSLICLLITNRIPGLIFLYKEHKTISFKSHRRATLQVKMLNNEGEGNE